MKKCFKHIAVMVMLTVLFFSSFPITALADEEISVTELSATGEITSDVNVRKGPVLRANLHTAAELRPLCSRCS